MRTLALALLSTCLLTGQVTALSLEEIDALWDFSDPKASEGRFQDRVAAASGEPAPEQPTQADRLMLLTQLARAQGLQGKFDAARETLHVVESSPELDENPLLKVRMLLEQGRVENSSGRPLRSMPYFQQALDVAREAGLWEFAADAAHMLAIAAPTKEAKVRWSLEGVRLAELGDDLRARRWLGPLYNNLGWTYHDAGDLEPALTSFCHALEYRTQQGKPDSIRIARWTVARCLRSLHRDAEALAHQEALLAEFQEAGERDGFVHEELAELYLRRGDLLLARPHAAQAYRLLRSKSWIEDSRLERLRIFGLGVPEEPQP